LTHAETIEATVTAPVAGTYGLWLGGTFQGAVAVSVDGRRVSGARDVLDWPGTFVAAGSVRLAAGRHALLVRYGGPDLHPGSAGPPEFGFGPIALGVGAAERPVTYVQPGNVRSLCGKRLDWVEAVGP
jgi:hypothetical protein